MAVKAVAIAAARGLALTQNSRKWFSGDMTSWLQLGVAVLSMVVVATVTVTRIESRTALLAQSMTFHAGKVSELAAAVKDLRLLVASQNGALQARVTELEKTVASGILPEARRLYHAMDERVRLLESRR